MLDCPSSKKTWKVPPGLGAGAAMTGAAPALPTSACPAELSGAAGVSAWIVPARSSGAAPGVSLPAGTGAVSVLGVLAPAGGAALLGPETLSLSIGGGEPGRC